MTMRPLPYIVAALLGVATALVAACGSERSAGLIPSTDAQRLTSVLADVETATASGNCDAVDTALAEARGALVNLPASVDDDLVARLRSGIANLDEVAPRECAEQATQTETLETVTQTEPTATTAPPATTSTTPTQATTQTTTETTPPAQTTTAPETTAPPEDTPEEGPPADETTGGATDGGDG